MLRNSIATNRYVPHDGTTTTAHARLFATEIARFRLATFDIERPRLCCVRYVETRNFTTRLYTTIVQKVFVRSKNCNDRNIRLFESKKSIRAAFSYVARSVYSNSCKNSTFRLRTLDECDRFQCISVGKTRFSAKKHPRRSP